MFPVFGVIWAQALPAFAYALLLGAVLSLHWLLSRWGRALPLLSSLLLLVIAYFALRSQPQEAIVLPAFGLLVGLSLLAGLSLFVFLWRRSLVLREGCEVWLASAVVALLAAKVGDWSLHRDAPLSWQGGLSSVFGLWVGASYGLWFCVYRGLSWRSFVGPAALSVLLALSVGKLACFFHGCDFGAPTESALAVTYPAEWPNALYPEGSLQSPISSYQHSEAFARAYPEWVPALAAYDDRSQGDPLSLPVHPLPLYESIGCLVLFLGLFLWRSRRSLDEQIELRVAVFSLAGYSLLRLMTELFRGDGEPLYSSLTLVQWSSIVTLLGLALLRLMRARG